MAFLIVSAGIGALGIIIQTVAECFQKDKKEKNTGQVLGSVLWITSIGFMCIILLLAGISNVDRSHLKEDMVKEHLYLTELYENDVFADNPQQEMELYRDIISYNDRANNILTKMESDWCNIFYPKSFWKDLPVIELKD